MFWIALLILIAIYVVVSIYHRARESKIHEHGLCCDECKVRDMCDKYKEKNNY